MTRFIKIPEYEDFFKSLKLSLSNFAVEMGVSTYSYFATKLHINGQNKQVTFSNLINSGTGKDLKVRELLLLLDNLEHHQKPILDYLCNRYGFICSESASSISDENFQDLFLKSANINGDIASAYLKAIEDGNIDKHEAKQLNDLLYQFRALIKSYEFGDHKDD